MRYLRVKNWKKFQHYKDRNPPWIRLYVDLISGDDLAYNRLPDALKIQLVHLWLLAARHDNSIPEDVITKHRLNVKGAVNLDALITAGFLECLPDASTPQATCNPSRDAHAHSASASVSASGSEPEGVQGEPKRPDFAAVARLMPKLAAAGFSYPPSEQMVTVWFQEFGEELILETLNDLGEKLRGKNYRYFETVCASRRDNPSERPSVRLRSGARPVLVEAPRPDSPVDQEDVRAVKFFVRHPDVPLVWRGEEFPSVTLSDAQRWLDEVAEAGLFVPPWLSTRRSA